MYAILLCVFAVVVVLQLLYYWAVFAKFSFKPVRSGTPKKIGVSVLVCAKNEEKNVERLIPLLAAQEYHDFEIVLIDDASSDDTLEVFERFQAQYPMIKIVKVVNNEAFWGNKKFALTLGIKAATKEYLLFIDADCVPASNQWLKEMAGQFTMQKTIVLGYGKYRKIPNSFLNKLIRYETLLAAVQYFGWTLAGKPYMGVGRNLAYKREEFFKVDGFRDHLKLRSGDDDLFVNQVATKKNTTYADAPHAFTISEPKTSFRTWFRQKRRHSTTANYYKAFDRLQLSIFYATQLAFPVLATVLLIAQFEWIIVVSLIGLRYLSTWLCLGFTAGKLQEKDTMYFYPILEIALVFTQLCIFIANTFSKPVQWK
ncbi:glycosyltransferase [Flavobacterium aurantiibacter]|uniref:Glycosyl transferase family 2 n=1 Tax=Flavobacterium aurantiibacter TaxID=2023067 RepID=A0A255ZCH6_9FLAO|nr:glycosyltransferase [Flavobacterium aurantiibacter]OYQ38604.1 glycosyl transferase family 2 [Flavobacterium aurantiibacter]